MWTSKVAPECFPDKLQTTEAKSPNLSFLSISWKYITQLPGNFASTALFILALSNNKVLPFKPKDSKNINASSRQESKATDQKPRQSYLAETRENTPPSSTAQVLLNMSQEQFSPASENLSQLSFSGHYTKNEPPTEHIYFMQYLIDLLYTCILDIVPFIPFTNDKDKETSKKIKEGFLSIRRDVYCFSDIPLLDGGKVINKKIHEEEKSNYIESFRDYFDKLNSHLKNIDVAVSDAGILSMKDIADGRDVSILLLWVQLFFLQYHQCFQLYGDRHTKITLSLIENFQNEFQEPFQSWVNYSEKKMLLCHKKNSFFNIKNIVVGDIIVEMMKAVVEIETFYSNVDLPTFTKKSNIKANHSDIWDPNKFEKYIDNAVKNLNVQGMQWLRDTLGNETTFSDKQEKNSALIKFFIYNDSTRQDCFRLMAYTGYMQRHGYNVDSYYDFNVLLNLGDMVLVEEDDEEHSVVSPDQYPMTGCLASTFLSKSSKSSQDTMPLSLSQNS